MSQLIKLTDTIRDTFYDESNCTLLKMVDISAYCKGHPDSRKVLAYMTHDQRLLVSVRCTYQDDLFSGTKRSFHVVGIDAWEHDLCNDDFAICAREFGIPKSELVFYIKTYVPRVGGKNV